MYVLEVQDKFHSDVVLQVHNGHVLLPVQEGFNLDVLLKVQEGSDSLWWRTKWSIDQYYVLDQEYPQTFCSQNQVCYLQKDRMYVLEVQADFNNTDSLWWRTEWFIDQQCVLDKENPATFCLQNQVCHLQKKKKKKKKKKVN